MTRSRLAQAIDATRDEEYLRAYTLFMDIYGSVDGPQAENTKAVQGLSFFGLCLALVQKKYKPAIDLCTRAIDLQFYNADHYANLARVYVAADKRKKAIETIERGLKVNPEAEVLTEVRSQLGIRSRPAVPFLDRGHPINVSLGQARHAKKVASKKGGGAK